MIKELRQKTGLSQQDFADRFNIPVSTLRQWEQGRRKAPDYVFCAYKRGPAKARIPCRDRLRRLAPMLLEWEASSSCNDNFVALIEDIDEAKEIADALIAHADALAIKVNTK